jgi:glutamate/tyrosine decarboxylase-like PLP-dependent enzyme
MLSTRAARDGQDGQMEKRGAALEAAHRHAEAWLESLDDRPVPPSIDTDEVVRRLGDLPEGPTPAAEVIDLLAEACEPGLAAIPSGRFFGMVIGGTLPAALGADWLTSVWDQNTGLRALTPAAAAVEEVAGQWILDLLGLPGDSAVGFVTGATMANFTCLAAARDTVLLRSGHDIRLGLVGGPPVRVVVGAERHPAVDLPLRFLGLGEPDVVPVDAQGRILADALASALASGGGPTIVVLQAGNIHSGDFDPFAECIAIAHEHDAWVHVDGAFGLWAAASPRWADDVSGLADADSWATDAHKTLNVPYDCGLAIVRDRDALASSMAMHGEYLIEATGDPQERVPELSRRARGFASWAALRSLGRTGVVALVEGLAARARDFAAAAATIEGVEVLNDVVFTQVCLTFGDDDRTRAVAAALLADGTTWMSGSRWHDRAIVRISVSNWSTTEDDVRRSLDALRRAAGV